MPKLIVDFHCMCLFVPDSRDGKRVHVLMPAMPGHCTGQPEQHVVRLFHRSLHGPDQCGVSMEGWWLRLGAEDETADITLNRRSQAPELPDLSAITGAHVDPALISTTNRDRISARVTLSAGRVLRRDSDRFGLRWALGGVPRRRLANRVTWEIPDITTELQWTSMEADVPKPFSSLQDLDAEANGSYRIAIHHETERTLRGESLRVEEMQHHFTAFYPLLNVAPPDLNSELVPQLEPSIGGTVMCRSAMAQLA